MSASPRERDERDRDHAAGADDTSLIFLEQPQFLTSGITDETGVTTATLTIPAGTDADEVEVSVFGGGVDRLFASTVTVNVTSTGPGPSAGEPSAITFEGAEPSEIGVRGSGRAEQSSLSFSVHDPFGAQLGGVAVVFSLNGLGEGYDKLP